MTFILDLPMEVYGPRVVVYVPFSDRLQTFHALRTSECLPKTNTNVPNAFMQFCSEPDQTRRTKTLGEEGAHALVDMGFADRDVRIALGLTNGSPVGALGYLLSEVLKTFLTCLYATTLDGKDKQA
jgi:hypothetical protein